MYKRQDDEAFRKIFKTGSFTDSEGMLAYALPAEDAYRGYTPVSYTHLDVYKRQIVNSYRRILIRFHRK